MADKKKKETPYVQWKGSKEGYQKYLDDINAKNKAGQSGTKLADWRTQQATPAGRGEPGKFGGDPEVSKNPSSRPALPNVRGLPYGGGRGPVASTPTTTPITSAKAGRGQAVTPDVLRPLNRNPNTALAGIENPQYARTAGSGRDVVNWYKNDYSPAAMDMMEYLASAMAELLRNKENPNVPPKVPNEPIRGY